MSRANLLGLAVCHATVARYWRDNAAAELACMCQARAELAAWHAARAGR